MKKFLILIITFFLGTLSSFAYSTDEDGFMTLDEYSRYFEGGFEEDEECEPIEEEYEPSKLKDRIDYNGQDVVKLEVPSIQLRVEKVEFLDPYRQVFQEPVTKNDLLKVGKLTIFSDSKKELSDYMTDNLKTTMNASYKVNDVLDIRGGQEIWYVNPNARLGAKKVYFNPRLNITNSCYLDYISRYNERNRNLEQEVGLNYKPRIFNDNASFGIKAGTIINDNHEIQSQKLKFSTDWYIY